MIVFLNGRFVSEERAMVSVFDRGFLYGDGLFEVVRICNGKPFRWAEHLQRFWRGADFLQMHPPYSPGEMEHIAMQLIAKNGTPEALLRLTLSRGAGLRGYSPKGADSPVFVMTLHPMAQVDLNHPPLWKLVTASHRLPARAPLASFKNANKLPQILARAEADAAGADEALLLNTSGRVVEGTTSNLFWVKRGVVCTPPLAAGILPGVTRVVVREICRALKIPSGEISPRRRDLSSAEGVFLSMSSWGIVEAAELDGRKLRRARCVKKIQQCYGEWLRTETA